MISRTLLRFMERKASGGVVLLVATVLAIFLANSNLTGVYHAYVVHPLQHPVNDGLMVLFFLLVGLEIKREVCQGELSTKAQALLPVVAAVGGMLVPSLVYLAIAWDAPGLWRGWAIPAATDIAFVLGALALLGRKVPVSIKAFVTAFAIIDDIGAVLIIGLFYTAKLNVLMLGAMAALCVLLWYLNRRGVCSLLVYVGVGALLWAATMQAGLHGTIAGVITALAVPLHRPGNRHAAEQAERRHDSPLRHFEHILHPWVTFGIVPLFALVNAGLILNGLSLANALDTLPLAIALGLVVGKQAGIFLACLLVIRFGWARVPDGSSLAQLYGAAVLGGIGFTMSQFIAGLAFTDPGYANAIKLGIIGGSLVSALWGMAVLQWFGQQRSASRNA